MDMINNNVEWFVGVVEDRMDPLKQGRVRVRVIGLHPFQKVQGPVSGMPTEDLPWMSVLQPITSASMSGIGGSVTGPVEGTHVYGHWLDKYRTNGLVMGTYGVNARVRPNTTEGFSDPTGQYPRYLGNDTNLLNQGGEAGFESIPNVIQDNNLDTAINPDDTDLSNIPEDNNPNYTIEAMLRRDEGLRLKVYWDTEGYPTIGIGHLIMRQRVRDMAQINKVLSNQVGREVKGNPGSITMDEASALFAKDLADMQRDIKTNSKVGPVYVKMNKSRQMALENMSFQMGVGGVANFTNMLKAMDEGRWKDAYNESRNSLWFQQTKGRASRVSMIILTGNMESYGVPVNPVQGKSVGAQLATVKASVNPSDPPIPSDSRILFKEPVSSYKGQYPYVHTMETESGHIQEFDDTPGYERYRLVHPTGTYEEVAPDGRRTRKTVNDLYDIANGDGNYLVSGDKKVNVGADETYYNMANRLHQIDGNNILFIRGDETKTVEGDGTLYVKGNIKIVVDGNADILVKGDAKTQVEGNHDYTVNGNVKWTVNGSVNMTVAGNWSETMSSMSSIAQGQYTIDGSRVDIGL
ncbi:baseplate hub subunit and tail lysozyme [Salmonella phage STML-198]|uniref:Baseplate central spike protein n=2 Tax=Gelderlandvirus TaxID=1913653 RepID=K4I659_9CAUD|nr:baseplate hub subunit and tail lysozyme [Salmonella phage STML-198]YP_009615627.1 baseplate hub subunit and tail lysozyme [Salmonella phage Melville]AFU64090.1 baseplate hub + tail lysozyme [Salmonella phage STML-198]ATN93115.1 baseplate hub subunit and tail lysozyme [Salmonella phage Melville]